MFKSEYEVEEAREEIEWGRVSEETRANIVEEILAALEAAQMPDGEAAEELARELVAEAANKYGFAESPDASDHIWVKANAAIDMYLDEEFDD